MYQIALILLYLSKAPFLGFSIIAHFHSDSNEWCNLNLLYIEIEDQLGSVLRFLLALSTIQAIPLFNLGLIFHIQRFWPQVRALNFLILATVVTGTSSSLEMVL